MDVIPQAAPARRLARYAVEIESALRGVLGSGELIGGRAVERFEAEWAAYTGARHCVSVNSGTDAVGLALRALGVGPGDEVLTVAMTAPGTGAAILQAGARPRFVDVDPATRCIDVDRLEAAISPRTAAVVPVHLHGTPADMPRIMGLADRHGLAVVEDCAQAHGARIGGRAVGTFGAAGAFSFYPTKNLGAAGDGGAVVTGDDELAGRLRELRSPVGETSPVRVCGGLNSRLDGVQAAVLSALLPHLGAGNGERTEIAGRYRDALAGLPVRPPLDAAGAVHHQYALTVADRDPFRARMAERGVGTGVHFGLPLHRHPAFERFADEPLPATDALAAGLVSLPIQPEVAREHVERIAEAVTTCLAS